MEEYLGSPVAYSPLERPSNKGQHYGQMDRGHSDYGLGHDMNRNNNKDYNNRRLTWSDGQPLATTAGPLRPSLPDVIATRLSHLSHHGNAGEDDSVPFSSERAQPHRLSKESVQESESEFREASVPVPRYWLLTVS